ncbi:MAG: nucleotidyltransferase family protein [Neomegalonema sp.]|nr:nucleotidyltransferase family protein [Neomegalonema sp.]
MAKSVSSMGENAENISPDKSSVHFSGDPLPEEGLQARLIEIIESAPLLTDLLERSRNLNLPAWRLVSGAIYNTVWNRLTGREDNHGINDLDIAYYDPDLSWEAEDRVIRAAAPIFADLPFPVEIRNQARVHLWYEARFGRPYAPLASVEEGIDRYAAKTHAVGVRLLESGALDIFTPYGLEPIFAMRMVPNHLLDNRETYERKAKRALECWPELTVESW